MGQRAPPLSNGCLVDILRAPVRSASTHHQPGDREQAEHLSPAELHRLTLFKWRYTLESFGFSEWQVDQLVFLTWLHATRRAHP
jgi:hypothetical protein